MHSTKRLYSTNRRSLKAILLLSFGSVLATTAFAGQYTETFETAPAGGFAALLTSPYGVQYDFYSGRAFNRLAGYPITVIGSGDEGFFFGNNSFMPSPLYGEPGTHYADDDNTSYVFNGYGTGEKAYGTDPGSVLGFDFTNGPTRFYSAQFSFASGSNAPTDAVTVVGLLGNTVEWTSSSAVAYGSTATITGGTALVDRIEVVRNQNATALFSGFPLAWYVMDNMSFDATGPDNGYTWHTETSVTYQSQGATPEPSSWLAMGSGMLGLLVTRRRRSKKH